METVMSIRSSIVSLLILGSALVTTSVAYARNPPALVRSQEAQGEPVASSGYRDSLARVRHSENATETVLRSAGYRDSLTRFAKAKPLRIAQHH
jgi:hypothetical protein